MDPWILWLVAACVFGAGELHTGGFFLAPFAVGAFAATILSLAGVGTAGAAIVFVAASMLVFLALRPLARSHRRLPPPIRTGAAALVGRSGDGPGADRQPRGRGLREDRRRGMDRTQL